MILYFLQSHQKVAAAEDGLMVRQVLRAVQAAVVLDITFKRVD
jgi:hypothetical protein